MSCESGAPRPDVAVRFTGVSKRYRLYPTERHRFLGALTGRVKHSIVYANRDLDFVIQRGESVAILGRNGAGKSTMLKMINEVSFPSSGTVEVNGRVSALLELTAGFDAEFTGRENVRLRGEIWGMDKNEIAALERKVVDFAEIGEYIDQPMRTYSSGMRARVGFAISVNIEPEILIIDEALSVGDKAFRAKCDAKIEEVMAQRHITILLVTHSSAAAAAVCARGMVLDKGALVFDGPIDDAIEFYEGERPNRSQRTDFYQVEDWSSAGDA
jgi:teichoic acid transport system ATP-binding protein